MPPVTSPTITEEASDARGKTDRIPSVEPTEEVTVQVAELLDGRMLYHPIRNHEGALLLTAGAKITARFKDQLRSRGIQEVVLHVSDAGFSPPQSPRPLQPRSAPGVVAQSSADLAARLDELVESGSKLATNSEPPFKTRLVVHGRTGYDAEQHALLVKQQTATCVILDELLKAAQRGEPCSGDEIVAVVSRYLIQYCADADCVLEVASQAHGLAAVAEQSLQTALLAMATAIEMGLGEGGTRSIGLGGLLHAWGMTGIPEYIRNANRVLTQAEFKEVQKHPIHTLEMLQRVSGLPADVSLICYQVREQPNGGGYPRGRRGEEIHIGARILHVASAYVAMTSPRPFRLPLTAYAAVECLVRNAKDKAIDPEVVRSLLHVISLFPIGSYVVLNDASTARVVRHNGPLFGNPLVQLVRFPDGSRIDTARETLLVDTATDDRKIVRAMPTPGRQEIALRPDLMKLRRA